jgi:DNA ligase-1
MKQFSLDGFLSGKEMTQSSKGENSKKTIKTETQKENSKNQPTPLKNKIITDELTENDLNPNLIPNEEKELKTEKRNIEENKQSSLPFMDLITVLLKVETIKGENSKDQIKELFAKLFVEIINNYPDDLPRVYYFLMSKIGPEYRSPEFGIGNGILEKIVSKVIGLSDKQLKDKLINVGDLGKVASEGKKNVQTMDKFTNFIKIGPSKPLLINQVLKVFHDVAGKKGKSSQDEKSKIICKLMFDANKDEIKFIVRSLQKSLKIGASFKTILSAFARAVCKLYKGKLDEKEIYKILLMSKNQLSDEDIYFNHIIDLIHSQDNFNKLVDLCHIRPGIPVNPQLARPSNGINVIFSRFEKIPFTCEYKYDGFRGQIHYYNNKTEIFSRNLENMTETYPDIVEYVNNFQKESQEKNNEQSINSFIIDCEMVAFDTKNNKILPFQQLTTRSRKNVDINTITIHVCMFVFDILYLNNEILINKTLRERREILYKTFKENEYIQFAKHLNSDNQEEIETFMTNSIDSGCEGLIIKAIDKNSEYMPGQRNFNWLKLKKDYLDTSLGDSIDLVVLGAQYGKGKRAGIYGSFLLGCYNDDSETYESVTMTGGGLKDSDLEDVYKTMKEHILQKIPSNYRLGEVKPEIIFEPYMVWEIKTADLTLSPIYTAGSSLQKEGKGISLRFPRFIRMRTDKKPNEAITSDEIVNLYESQAAINKNNNNIANEDIDDLY